MQEMDNIGYRKKYTFQKVHNELLNLRKFKTTVNHEQMRNLFYDHYKLRYTNLVYMEEKRNFIFDAYAETIKDDEVFAKMNESGRFPYDCYSSVNVLKEYSHYFFDHLLKLNVVSGLFHMPFYLKALYDRECNYISGLCMVSIFVPLKIHLDKSFTSREAVENVRRYEEYSSLKLNMDFIFKAFNSLVNDFYPRLINKLEATKFGDTNEATYEMKMNFKSLSYSTIMSVYINKISLCNRLIEMMGAPDLSIIDINDVKEVFFINDENSSTEYDIGSRITNMCISKIGMYGVKCITPITMRYNDICFSKLLMQYGKQLEIIQMQKSKLRYNKQLAMSMYSSILSTNDVSPDTAPYSLKLKQFVRGMHCFPWLKYWFYPLPILCRPTVHHNIDYLNSMGSVSGLSIYSVYVRTLNEQVETHLSLIKRIRHRVLKFMPTELSFFKHAVSILKESIHNSCATEADEHETEEHKEHPNTKCIATLEATLVSWVNAVELFLYKLDIFANIFQHFTDAKLGIRIKLKTNGDEDLFWLADARNLTVIQAVVPYFKNCITGRLTIRSDNFIVHVCTAVEEMQTQASKWEGLYREYYNSGVTYPSPLLSPISVGVNGTLRSFQVKNVGNSYYNNQERSFDDFSLDSDLSSSDQSSDDICSISLD